MSLDIPATATQTTLVTMTLMGAPAAATLSAVATGTLTGDTISLPTDSRTSVAIGVLSFILPFTTSVVALRFYTRHFLSRTIGVDDWVILAALIFAIVDGATMYLMVTKGLGKHIWTLSAETIKTYNMYFYLSIVFYYVCLGTVKTAILLQYLRFFAIKMRKITLVAMSIMGLWSTALVLVSVFACQPIPGFWDKDVKATCVKELPQWYVNAAGNIITDVILFTLPIPVLWKLNLPLSQRLSLIGVFCLGFFACTISVIRITFLNLNGDDTYANVAAASWSIGEVCCGIVCSCLPTLRPFLSRVLPHTWLRSRQHKQQHRVPGGGDHGPGSRPGDHGIVPLKSVRSGGLGSPHPPFDVESNNSQSRASSQQNHHQPSSYYNRFYHHFHPHDSGCVPSISLLTNNSKTGGEGNNPTGSVRNRGDDSDLESERHSVMSHDDPEKRVLEAVTVKRPKATHTTTTTTTSAAARPSIRDLVSVGVAGYHSGRNSRSNSPRAPPAGQRTDTTSTENLTQVASPPAVASPMGLRAHTATPETDRAGGGSGAFFLGDDEDPVGNNTAGGGGGSRSGRDNGGNEETAVASFLSPTPHGPSPAPSSAPSPASTPTSTPPPRAYSYNHLRRMAAAVGAGVGAAVNGAAMATATAAGAVAGGVAVVSGNNSSSSNNNSSSSRGSQGGNAGGAAAGTAVGAAGLPPDMDDLAPEDPLSPRRDAYLGLRQGTVTSIQAGRPSTAEAAEWELPTGPGIQIRREVAQNVETSNMV